MKLRLTTYAWIITVLCAFLGGRYSVQPALRRATEIESKARLMFEDSAQSDVPLSQIVDAETDLRQILGCEESSEAFQMRLEIAKRVLIERLARDQAERKFKMAQLAIRQRSSRAIN